MYPRNAASPERISIGAVVQISDGAVQTSGVTVKVIPFGGTEATGGGTTAYSADGIVLYTPTQSETNYTSFVVAAVKSGCIPASVTIVTTASSTAGKSVVASIDNSAITAAAIASDAITDAKVAADVTIASVTGSVGSVSSYGSLVSDIATAVWGAGTRSLTTFGSLASDVWAVATRTLTAASDSSGVTTLLSRIVGTLASGTHSPQSGDAFARLGAPAGASVSADIADLPTNAELATALGTADDAVLTAIAAEAVKTAAIKAKTDNLPTDPADASDIAASFSTVNGTLATLATAANLATVAGYLDTEITSILAIANKLDSAMELDGGVYRFTINALEQAPSGSGGGSTDWTADERTAIRTILGVPASGTTPEVPAAGALRVIDDLLDTEIGALITAVADLPTNVELATALGTGSWATAIPWNAAWDTEVQSECTDALNAYDAPTKAEMDTAFTEIKGATWSSSTDTLEAIRDRGDAAWVTGSGGSGGSSTGNGTGSTAALRGTTDLTPIQFTFPTPSLNNAAFTTKTKRIDGGSSANITGAISFLYSINGEHYYQIAYNAADRPSAAGVVTYLISDGTSTVSFDLQVIAIASDGGIAVLPGRDRAVADAGASTITVKLGEIITIARGVVDANGQPMDLSGFNNLQFVVQDARGVDLATVNHADITISGANDDTYSFVTPSAMTAKLGVFDFSLNQVGGGQIVGGKWIVLRRAVAD